MSPLDSDDRRQLLEVARRAIVQAVERNEPIEIPAGSERLNEPGAVFVSLHIGRRLRGCIGNLGGHEPLIEAVARCARSAALEDPRFRPVEPQELKLVEVEVSVLSGFRLANASEVVTGEHGVVVSRGGLRGLLLPQVAVENHLSSERFLEEACCKAGLAPDAWRDANTKIEIFTAEVFSEGGLRNGSVPSQEGGRYSSST